MLPVLKEAGVVDAGGLGLVVFLEGWLFAMQNALGEILARKNVTDSNSRRTTSGPVAFFSEEIAEIDHPYCTELLIKSTKDTLDLKDKLKDLGDSLIVVCQDNINKVHIHTANPGQVLMICEHYGSLHDIKIDNMADQHQHALGLGTQAEPVVTLARPLQEKTGDDIGIITVSFGEGTKEIFLGLGADEIVYGGQTMNPRVEDLLCAVEKLPTKKVLILPNNKNIHMVAGQVQNLTSKEVAVIGSRSIAQGIAALVAFNPASNFEDNIRLMEESLGEIKSGEITHAIRDTTIGGEKISQGSYLGLFEEKICSAGAKLDLTALDLVKQMIDDQDELITILYGQEVSSDEAEAFASAVGETWPEVEVELKYGGQPIYYYIFAIE